MTKHGLVVVALLVGISVPLQGAVAQEGAGAVTRALEILSKLTQMYPTLAEPRHQLVASAQAVTVLEFLIIKTEPSSDEAAKLREMLEWWTRRRLVDLKETMDDIAMLNAALQNEDAPGNRTALLRRALDDMDAMLEHLPLGADDLRETLVKQRARVLEGMREAASTPVAELPAETNPPEETLEPIAIEATSVAAVASAPAVPRDGGQQATAVVTAAPHEGGGRSPKAETSAIEKVWLGISSIATVLLGGAAAVLLAGPILGVCRWLGIKYVQAARALWSRYGRPAQEGEPTAEPPIAAGPAGLSANVGIGTRARQLFGVESR